MKKSILVALIGVILLISMEGVLKKEDSNIYSYEYRGANGLSQETFFAKALGVKKAGSSLLWLKQVVIVGENLGNKDVEGSTNKIYKGSKSISYLDPYFIGNYQFSGSILAFIKTYRKFDMAFDIFEEGLYYNPNDTILKKYLAGIIASSKGDIVKILEVFEEIVAESRDDLLINTLAFTYEQAYEKTNSEVYLGKSLYYWEMLLDSKDEKYRIRATEKLEKYIQGQAR